jgi:hypothetical protein
MGTMFLVRPDMVKDSQLASFFGSSSENTNKDNQESSQTNTDTQKSDSQAPSSENKNNSDSRDQATSQSASLTSSTMSTGEDKLNFDRLDLSIEGSYIGQIAGKFRFALQVRETNEEIEGRLFNYALGRSMQVEGRATTDGAWQLQAIGPKGNNRGQMKVYPNPGKPKRLQGQWRPPTEASNSRIIATEVTDLSIPSSQKPFNNLVASPQVTREQTTKYEYQAVLPTWKSGNETSQTVTQKIQQRVQETFQKSETVSQLEQQAECNNNNSDCEQKAFYDLTYVVTYNQNQILSLEFIETKMIPQEFAPQVTTYTWNYSLETGNKIELDQILKDPTQKQKQAITQAISEQNPKVQNTDNLQQFVLSPQGLKFWVTNQADRETEVVLPWAQASGWLREKK